jgi:hypothetical protein
LVSPASFAALLHLVRLASGSAEAGRRDHGTRSRASWLRRSVGGLCRRDRGVS